MIGLVHPCKIYNIFTVAAPVIYIGPEPSHVTEILAKPDANYPWWFVRHGEVEKLVEHILAMRNNPPARQTATAITKAFTKDALLPQMIAGLENTKIAKCR